MTFRLALPALTLALVLAACGGGTPPDDGNTGICPQGLTPAALPAPSPREVRPASLTEPNWLAPHVPGQVLVTETGGTLSTQGLSLLSTVRTQAVVAGVSLAVTPAGETDRAFAARLESAGLHAQPNFIYRPLALPDDPGYPGNAGVKVSGDNVTYFQDYLTRIRAAGAWSFLEACGKTPVGALTAVLDSGVDSTHPDLRGRLLAGRSFVGTAADTSDAEGHGTAVAGLIGASTNNATGLAGVTWSGRNVLPVKVLGDSVATTATLARALDYAVGQGAKVINLSLGFEPQFYNPATNPGDAALDRALSEAAHSAVILAAAGNSSGQGVYYPASHPDVVAVGAVGAKDNELAPYSARPNAAYPRPLDIVAPGGTAARATALLVLNRGGGYQLSAGTSDATPLVSGVVALMRAANPNLTAAQTRDLLLQSVRRIQSPNFPGTGLPLLDAEAAVRAATR